MLLRHCLANYSSVVFRLPTQHYHISYKNGPNLNHAGLSPDNAHWLRKYGTCFYDRLYISTLNENEIYISWKIFVYCLPIHHYSTHPKVTSSCTNDIIWQAWLQYNFYTLTLIIPNLFAWFPFYDLRIYLWFGR